MVILCDGTTKDEQKRNHIENLCRLASRPGPGMSVISVADDGNLVRGVGSPYRFFTESQNASSHKERLLYYDFIPVPRFWEVRVEGTNGAIYDKDIKKATVYMREPAIERNVSRVEWCTEDGFVYKTDFYDDYALRYMSEFHAKGIGVASKVYYTDENKEAVIVNSQNNCVMLLENSQVRQVFSSPAEFIKYYLGCLPYDGKVGLFIQDVAQIDSLSQYPNWQREISLAICESAALLQEYQAAGGGKGVVFIEEPDDQKANRNRPVAMTLTDSDQCVGLEEVARALPGWDFHVAAHTEVSDTLGRIGELPNVHVYPGVSKPELCHIWEESDFYLDINRYAEVDEAVNTASLRNLLVLGFADTLHNPTLTASECIVEPGDINSMIQMLKDLSDNPAVAKRMLSAERRKRKCAYDLMVEAIMI